MFRTFSTSHLLKIHVDRYTLSSVNNAAVPSASFDYDVKDSASLSNPAAFCRYNKDKDDQFLKRMLQNPPCIGTVNSN